MTFTTGAIGFDCGETIDTRTAIRTLRNNGELEPGCVYTANNINWVLAGGANAKFSAIALDESTLSMHGHYESDDLNPGEPWEGYLDWDTGRVFYLHDGHIRENEVYGDAEVRSFPWDVTTVRRTTIKHSSFVYTGGTVDNVRVNSGGELIISSGSIVESDIISSGRIRVLGDSDVRDVTAQAEGRLYITADGAIVNQATFAGEATVTLSGAARVEESHYDDMSFVYLDGGSHYRFNATNSSYVDGRGWSGNFRQVDLTRMDVRVTGTGTIQNCILDGLGYIRIRDGDNVQLNNLSCQGYGYLIADRSTNFTVRYTGFTGMGYIYASDSVGVTVERSELDSNGILNLTRAQNLTVTRGKLQQNGQVYALNASGRIDYLTMSEASYMRMDNATGIDIDQSVIGVGSYVDLRNTTGVIMREYRSDTNSNIYADGASGIRFRYGQIARSNVYLRDAVNVFFESPQMLGGYYNFDRATDVTLNYLSSSGYGYVWAIACPQGRLDRVTLAAYGLMRLRNDIAAGWRISDTLINSQSDLRHETGGAVTRTTLASRGILVARHTGTIDRAHIMQTYTVQTVPSSNLRLHSGGAY